MDVILFMLNVAWKLLAIFIGWMLLKWVVKNGSDGVKEFLETISAILKAVGAWIREKCNGYLNKESAEQTTVDKEAATAAYNEYLKQCRAKCMTFEEFYKKMASGEPFTLD